VCGVQGISGNSSDICALVETVCESERLAAVAHASMMDAFTEKHSEFFKTEIRVPATDTISSVYAGAAACFSMQHLMDIDSEANEEAQLFPVNLYSYKDSEEDWTLDRTVDSIPLKLHASPSLDPTVNYADSLAVLGDDISGITCDKAGTGRCEPKRALSEVARVIRSKNAGINEITYDVMFNSVEDLDYAIVSGMFTPAKIAGSFGFEAARVLGCFKDTKALSIKFTLVRDRVVGDPGERDVYGAQQARRLFDWQI
jgi:hypothetical protein